MQELGFDIAHALPWFPHETETPYVLIRVDERHANAWAEVIRDAFRRCYLTDAFLAARAQELEQELQGTPDTRQTQIINSKLPDAGPTMAGDFGEILVYFYQSAKAHPQVAFGPKKWRLKQDRSKPAPCSDVVHFILPTWPEPSVADVLLCAEVKTKSTNGASRPIEEAIVDCTKDRISRLAKTLVWLRDRAVGENLGNVQIAQLNRFINANDFPAAIKRFRAVAVICSSLVEAELNNAPRVASADYTLVIIAVPNLHAVYTAVFEAVRASSLAEVQAP